MNKKKPNKTYTKAKRPNKIYSKDIISKRKWDKLGENEKWEKFLEVFVELEAANEKILSMSNRNVIRVITWRLKSLKSQPQKMNKNSFYWFICWVISQKNFFSKKGLTVLKVEFRLGCSYDYA